MTEPTNKNRPTGGGYESVIGQFKKLQDDKKGVTKSVRTETEQHSKTYQKTRQKTEEKTADIVLNKNLPTKEIGTRKNLPARFKNFISNPFHSSEKKMSPKKVEKKANEILTKFPNLTSKKQERLNKSLDSYSIESRNKLEESIIAKLDTEKNKQKKDELISQLKDKYSYAGEGPLSTYFKNEEELAFLNENETKRLREMKDETDASKKRELRLDLKENYTENGPIQTHFQDEAYQTFQGKNAFFQSTSKLKEYAFDNKTQRYNMEEVLEVLAEYKSLVPEDKGGIFDEFLEIWEDLNSEYKQISSNKEYSQFYENGKVKSKIQLSNEQRENLIAFKSKLEELQNRAKLLDKEMVNIPETTTAHSPLPRLHNLQNLFISAGVESLKKEVDQLLVADKS